jgi:hypothetical protein
LDYHYIFSTMKFAENIFHFLVKLCMGSNLWF